MDDPHAGLPPDIAAALASQGPISPRAATGLLDHGQRLLEAGEPLAAAGVFRRVIGFDDAAVTAAAWLGLGDALYRLDDEADAVSAWESVVRLPETPSTYQAWRRLAGARVRTGDLRAATEAYRQADRRAPAEDKAEIAGRLGWLAKETGNQSAAQRYFARSRGGAPLGLAQAVLGLTVLVSFLAFVTPDDTIVRLLWLDHASIERGELYRLLSVTLVHANFIHLFFNMYALYLLGPIVEGIWGSRMFALFYVLTAAAASTLSFVMGPGPSVGASGAIFGLMGALIAFLLRRRGMLTPSAKSLLGQLVMWAGINVYLGMSMPRIDLAAHFGGFVMGFLLGLALKGRESRPQPQPLMSQI